MIGAVHHRPREVVEARVDDHEAVGALALGRAHARDERARLGHQETARLDLEADRMPNQILDATARTVPERVERSRVERRLAGSIWNRQAATTRDRAHVDAEHVHLLHHRFAYTSQVLEVGPRPDVHVQTAEFEPVLLDVAQRLVEIGVPDAVLAPLAARVGLAAVAVSEARVHAQPDAVTGMPPSELLEHVRRARVDGDVLLHDAVERRLVDQVRGVDDAGRLAAPVVARAQRALDLA